MHSSSVGAALLLALACQRADPGAAAGTPTANDGIAQPSVTAPGVTAPGVTAPDVTAPGATAQPNATASLPGSASATGTPHAPSTTPLPSQSVAPSATALSSAPAASSVNSIPTASTSAPATDSGEPPAPPSDGGAHTPPGVSTEAGADELCDVGVWDGSTPQVLELSGATFAHDPSMIEANGVFYRFWTGDNIPVATSTDLRNWSNATAVYADGYPDWVSDWRADYPGNTFNFPWAPDVSYFGGRFHLYSSFSAFFGRNVSCITHLSTDDPAAGNWNDHGPVICTDGNQPYNAIDADVAVAADGTPWLAFGSFWDGIMAFELDQQGGRVGNDVTHLAWAPEIEAPVLFHRCGYYYLFVSWGLCCPGEGRSVDDLSYRVVVGRSENILGPYVDRDGVPLLDGGGTLLLEGDGAQFAAAGHSDVIVQGETIYHFYHAYRQSNGDATLRIVELPFDAEGWPLPGGP